MNIYLIVLQFLKPFEEKNFFLLKSKFNTILTFYTIPLLCFPMFLLVLYSNL